MTIYIPNNLEIVGGISVSVKIKVKTYTAIHQKILCYRESKKMKKIHPYSVGSKYSIVVLCSCKIETSKNKLNPINIQNGRTSYQFI